MKYLPYLILLVLVGCTTPMIIPDNTSDNVIMMAYKDQIAQEGGVKPSYGWVFWYIPVGLIAMMWAYREFIKKPIPKECVDKNGEIATATNNQEPPTTQ